MDENGSEGNTIEHGTLLGAYVRERRKALGITQEAVVARMGPDVPQNYVTQLENGARKRMIPQPRLGQLARALRVSEVELLRGAGMIMEPADQKTSPPSEVESLMSELSPTVRDGLMRTLRGFVESLHERDEGISLPPAAASR